MCTIPHQHTVQSLEQPNTTMVQVSVLFEYGNSFMFCCNIQSIRTYVKSAYLKQFYNALDLCLVYANQTSVVHIRTVLPYFTIYKGLVGISIVIDLC